MQNSTQRCRKWQSGVLFGLLEEHLFQAHTHPESVDELLLDMRQKRGICDADNCKRDFTACARLFMGFEAFPSVL